jgi:hypothetical protein
MLVTSVVWTRRFLSLARARWAVSTRSLPNALPLTLKSPQLWTITYETAGDFAFGVTFVAVPEEFKKSMRRSERSQAFQTRWPELQNKSTIVDDYL